MRNPQDNRYSEVTHSSPYRNLGSTGLKVPVISLGLWQNFGSSTALETQRDLVLHSFDRGVTHFDLANNYGPPAGSAEEHFGRILQSDLKQHRHELLITTKAGYRLRPGPYGEGGSRKYLLSSLNNSLKLLGIDHVDIFYSHRFDPSTPLEETLGALKSAILSGKALYAGISSYSATRTLEALKVAREIDLPLTVHQPSYSLLNRWIEVPDESGQALVTVCEEAGLGVVAFSPLAQGLLTAKYLKGEIPVESRASANGSFSQDYVSERNVRALRALNEIAVERNQTLAQMSLAWALQNRSISSVIIGARTLQQLDENLDAAHSPVFSEDDLCRIDSVATDGKLNLWGSRSSDL